MVHILQYSLFNGHFPGEPGLAGQRQHMTTAGRQLEMCLTDVSHWMAANRLKLNADKTELLWTGSKYGSTLLGSSGPPLRLGD